MAEFTKTNNPFPSRESADFTRRSRGFDTAEGLQAAVTRQQGRNVSNIETVSRQKDEFYEELGKDTGSMVLVANDVDDGRLPPALVRDIERLTVQGRGAARGATNADNFHLQALAASKRMQRAHPAYSNEIKKGIASILGIRPAMAVLADRQRQMKDLMTASEKRSSDQKKLEARAAFSNPVAYNRWQAAKGRGEDANILDYVTEEGLLKHKREMEDRRLTNLSKQNALDRTEVQKTLTDRAMSYIKTEMDLTTGSDYNNIVAQQKKYQEAILKGEDPKNALLKLGGMAKEWGDRMKIGLDKVLLDNPEIAAYDPTVTDNVRKVAQQMITQLQDAVTTGDFDTAKLASIAVQEGETYHKRKAQEAFGALGEVRKLVGEKLWGTMVDENGALKTAAQYATFSSERDKMVRNAESTLSASFETLKQVQQAEPEVLEKIVDTAMSGIGEKDTPLPTRERLFNYLTKSKHEGLFDGFTQPARQRLFARLTTPKMFNDVKALGKELGKEKEVLGQYRASTANLFYRVNQDQMTNLARTWRDSSLSVLTLNPTTLNLEEQKVQPKGTAPGGTAEGLIRTITPNNQQAIKDFNTTIRAFFPIWDDMNIDRRGKINEINELLKAYGIDLTDQSKLRGERGLISRFLQEPERGVEGAE